MSVFEWTPTDKQTDVVKDFENEEYNDPGQMSPWYGQQPTQGWYPMMTRAVPSYMPNYQIPTVRAASPSPSPSPDVKRRPLRRRFKPCLPGYRGVALLILFLTALMIGAIVYAIVLSGSGTAEPPGKEEVQGKVKLDGIVYKESYGYKQSIQYKHLAAEFCKNMMNTLRNGKIGEDAQLCRVESFKNGSVDVAFTITVQQFSARDPGRKERKQDVLAEVIKEDIVNEAKKKDGLFDMYQKDPGSMEDTIVVATGPTRTTATTITTTTTAPSTTTTTIPPSTTTATTTTPPSTTTTTIPPSTTTMSSMSPVKEASSKASANSEKSPTTTVSSSEDESPTPQMTPSKEVPSATHAAPSTQTQSGAPTTTTVSETSASVSVSTATASVKSPTTTVGISSSEPATSTAPPDERTTTPVPEICTNTTCENSGTCNDTDAGPVCTCADGYSGERCAHKMTFCELQAPCKNGGTCVDEGEDNYVCVCPKCGCSQIQPFDNCTIDNTTVCTGQYTNPFNLIPHPYDCKKFVNCTKDGTYVEDKFVWSYEDGNHVFDPVRENSAFPKDIICAKQIDIKLCADVNCTNGGTCKDSLGGFKCTCTSGYKGLKCEEVIETCTPDTCENNGTCSNTSTGINCACPSGYGGILCEKKIQSCNEVTCDNGATCINNTDTGHTCVCAAGFTGDLCETEMTFCQINMPCKHGGTCVDLSDDKYVCVCPRCGCSNEMPFDNCTIDEANICKPENIRSHLVAHPYNCSQYIDCKGPNDTYVGEPYVDRYQDGNVYDPENGWSIADIECAKPIEVKLCAEGTCANNGTCEDTMNGFKCHCQFGHYKGSMCENKLTSCDKVTCQHGTCQNTENGFYCNCTENYVGNLCQTLKIPCSSAVKCLNGATCRDTDVGPTCDCVAGYTGETCETDIDDCASNPCHANYSMSCEDKVNGYNCPCHTCSCSNVTVKDDCTLDSLTGVSALAACAEAKAAYPEEAEYYLPHPYKCTKYIWCYSSGANGSEQQCAGKGLFNPSYTSKNALCTDSVPACTQS